MTKIVFIIGLFDIIGLYIFHLYFWLAVFSIFTLIEAYRLACLPRANARFHKS